MNHHKVRIQRSRKSDAQMLFGWAKALLLLVGWLARPYIDQNRTVMQEAKLEEIRTRTQVAEMRKQKLANELVLQDMKIELTKHELKIRNIGQGSNESDAPSYEIRGG